MALYASTPKRIEVIDLLNQLRASQLGEDKSSIVDRPNKVINEAEKYLSDTFLYSMDKIEELKSELPPIPDTPFVPPLNQLPPGFGGFTEKGLEQEVEKFIGDTEQTSIDVDAPTTSSDTVSDTISIGEREAESTAKKVTEGLMSSPTDIPEGGLGSPDRSGVQTGTTVKEAQQTLTDLGYKPQGVDGILGKGSARAIRKLQKAADLPITGELTTEVIALLKSGNAPAYFDPPKKDAKVENISDSMFDVFKEAIAQKESSGRYSTYDYNDPDRGIKKGDPLYGGANMHYVGRYQMGKVALQDVGRGYSKTLNQAFLDDPDLQDKLFKKYTLQNHKALTKNSKKYREMSIKEKLGVLGYAHNQGAVSAEEWLYTGVSGADGLGTKGDEYTSLVRDAFAEESPDDMPN